MYSGNRSIECGVLEVFEIDDLKMTIMKEMRSKTNSIGR